MDITAAMPKAPYWLFVLLVLILAGLQYRLWVGDGSLAQVQALQQQIAEQQMRAQQKMDRSRMDDAIIKRPMLIGAGQNLLREPMDAIGMAMSYAKEAK